MATLYVGWYPINNHTAEHSYAIMVVNGTEYRFHCHGGVSDDDNEYPAVFYHPASIWYTRDSQKTNYWSVECPYPQMAIHLATWDSDINHIDMNRYDYDRKSGGYMGTGDSSGLIYGITGLCHQMCNTITCAANPENPLKALINWPASLNSSKILLGNWGTQYREQSILAFMDILKKIYCPYGRANCEAPDRSAAKALDDVLSQCNERMLNGLKATLKDGHPIQERAGIVGSIISGREDQAKLQQAILDRDTVVMSEKNELDNLLLRRQISFQEYADQVNSLLNSLLVRYEDVMGQDAFSDHFGAAAAHVNCNVVDTKMMSEETYDAVRKNLGI